MNENLIVDDSGIEYLEQPKESHKRKFQIAAGLLLLCAIAGAAYWYFAAGGSGFVSEKIGILTGSMKYEEVDEDVVIKGVKKTVKKKVPTAVEPVVPPRDAKKVPVSVPMDIFTVNLTPATSEKFLQIALVLDFSDVKAADEIKPYVPAMRNAMLVLMSGKSAEDLATQDGKERLRVDLDIAIRKVAPKEKLEHFYGVLFTGFVIQ